MASFYRIQDADISTNDLLDPAMQLSTSYCTSTTRTGVSVCDSLEELAEYFSTTGIPFDATSVVVELAGYDSEDDDEDAHLGARLIMPTAVLSVTPITDVVLDLIDAAYDAAYDAAA